MEDGGGVRGWSVSPVGATPPRGGNGAQHGRAGYNKRQSGDQSPHSISALGERAPPEQSGRDGARPSRDDEGSGYRSCAGRGVREGLGWGEGGRGGLRGQNSGSRIQETEDGIQNSGVSPESLRGGERRETLRAFPPYNTAGRGAVRLFWGSSGGCRRAGRRGWWDR